MKLQQLRIFESIARHLNVTAAAAEVRMSQPAASLQLKLLEEEFGFKCFQRTNRGMELTGKGREFLDAIRPILEDIDKLEATLKVRSPQLKPPVLALGTTHTLSATILPDILLNFQKHHPDIQLELETADSRTIESWVASSRIEIALLRNPVYLPTCKYEVYRELEDETVVFVAADSRVPECSMTFDELVKYPLVVRAGGILVEELQKRGFKLKLAVKCHAPDAVKMAVLKGMGVGLVVKSWILPELERGDLRMIDVPELKSITSKCFIVYDNRKPLSESAQSLVRALRKMRSSLSPS